MKMKTTYDNKKYHFSAELPEKYIGKRSPKLLKRAVFDQMHAHLSKHDLYPMLESAYRQGHSNTTKQKPIKILWIYSGEIYKIFMPYSPDFHG